jgi:hypothetical protein
LAVQIVEATPHSLLAEPLDSSLRAEGESGSKASDLSASAVKSAGPGADEQGSVDRARGPAEDALRVL